MEKQFRATNRFLVLDDVGELGNHIEEQLGAVGLAFLLSALLLQ